MNFLFVHALGDAKSKGESDTAADPKARSCTTRDGAEAVNYAECPSTSATDLSKPATSLDLYFTAVQPAVTSAKMHQRLVEDRLHYPAGNEAARG